jgi:glutamate--cysteine ligase
MNLTDLIESVILSNLRPYDERKIGIEFESYFYNNDLKRIPTNPADRFSSTDLMNEMIDFQSGDEIKAGYSLEPGGQLEWASPPMKSLHEINAKLLQHKIRVSEILKREKLMIVDYSLEPLYNPQEIELINNEKYRLMDRMFINTGKLGQWMMRNTSSIQINIDFSSKEEAERMAYVADCISPIASILFANSPFWKGVSSGSENLRYKIWSNTDNFRCGNLLDHGMFESKGLISRYAQYIQSVPAIFIEDEKGGIISYKHTLGSWLKELFSQNKLTDRHIHLALHQIFTHVRFKNVLEIRVSDKPPAGFELAPAAFWTGLLFEDETLSETFNIIKKWTPEDREKLNLNAYKLDLEQRGPENTSIGEWINGICDISLKGLNRRSKKNDIDNEDSFLKEYLDVFTNVGILALDTQKKRKNSGKTVREFV